MTDKTNPPTPEPKDAVPAGHFTKPEAKQISFSQQLGIWILILVVGVVFGIGTPVSMLFGSQAAKEGDVSQAEISQRMQIAQRMDRILCPQSQPKFMPTRGDPSQVMAEQLRVARLADSRGLMPKGQALDRIESDFLSTPLDGSPGRTYRDALAEHMGGAEQVPREDLRRFLAERAARQGLFARAAVPPVVPRDIGSEAYLAVAEQAEVAKVVLTASKLLPEVKADDPEIQAAYERLRADRFQRPVGVAINLAYVERDSFLKDVQASDADIKAWYDAHQGDYRDPKLGTADKPVIRPFDQVKDEVTTAVRNDRAANRAAAVAERFSGEVDVLDGDKDPTKFIAAAKKEGMQIEDLDIEDHTPGTIDLGKHGTVKDLIGLFSHEHDPGFISRPAETSSGAWVVIRLVSRREAGYQELDTVRPQVIKYLEGHRAWKTLLAKAEELRSQLKTPGALAAWAASEDAKQWDAKLATASMSTTETLPTPPADADGQSGEPLLVGKLAMPDRPVAVAEVFQAANRYFGMPARLMRFNADVPQVQLVQVSEIKAADLKGMDAKQLASVYRQILGDYSESLLDREIRQQLEKQ